MKLSHARSLAAVLILNNTHVCIFNGVNLQFYSDVYFPHSSTLCKLTHHRAFTVHCLMHICLNKLMCALDKRIFAELFIQTLPSIRANKVSVEHISEWHGCFIKLRWISRRTSLNFTSSWRQVKILSFELQRHLVCSTFNEVGCRLKLFKFPSDRC
jgi:hypothetical protein